LRRGGESKLLLKSETEKIIGFAFEVLNELGHGLNEKIYENSLVVLFKRNEISFDHCGRKSNRPDHRSRARSNVELFADHKIARRFDFKFQKAPLGI
jgi:GxxExxY protein